MENVLDPLSSPQVPTSMILETDRTFLRYPALTDVDHILSAIQNPAFPELLPLKEIDNISDGISWLKNLQQLWLEGKGYSWIITDQQQNKIIGQVTLNQKDYDEVWALAFWIDPSFWGNGFATEAADRVIRFGYDFISMKKIWAGAGIWNQASRNVLNKLGFKFIRENAKGYYVMGKPVITHEFELSYDHWKKLN